MRARNPGITITLMLLCGVALPGTVAAQVRTTAPLIPLEHFFDNPEQPTVAESVTSHLKGLIIDPDSVKLGSKKP